METIAQPVASTAHVALPRREYTEEPDNIIQLSSDALLDMSDQELYALLDQLGIIPQNGQQWTRDKMIGLVLKVSLSAQDIVAVT